MPRITKVYTKTGDDGTTSLATGRRVPKDDLRIEATGMIDELNAHIGDALALGIDASLKEVLSQIQQNLFHLGADLSVPEPEKAKLPVPKIEKRHSDFLESFMDHLTEELGPLENFILPGGSSTASRLHLARAVARKAERTLVALNRREALNPETIRYANRLSDALFVMARYENKKKGFEDVTWQSRM